MDNGKNRFPRKVSNAVVRIVAAEVCALALVVVVSRNPWVACALAVDFGIRAFVTPLVSPLRVVGSYAVLPLLAVKDSAVFFSPKRFAAMIGFSVTVIAFLALVLSAPVVGFFCLGLLVLFSFLEAAFGFCVGCKIYGFLMRHGIIPASWCPECVGS